MPKPDILAELRGEIVLLRAISPADVGPRYVSWMNDPEVVKYTESRFEPHTTMSLQAYLNGVLADPDSIMWAICAADNREHVGNIKLGPVNWRHGFGDVGIIVGDRACWGRGVATESISLLCSYAFEELNLHKLTASMYAPNIGSRRAFEKCGFQLEGIKRSQYLFDGRYVDLLVMGKVNNSR